MGHIFVISRAILPVFMLSALIFAPLFCIFAPNKKKYRLNVVQLNSFTYFCTQKTINATDTTPL